MGLAIAGAVVIGCSIGVGRCCLLIMLQGIVVGMGLDAGEARQGDDWVEALERNRLGWCTLVIFWCPWLENFKCTQVAVTDRTVA